MIDLPDADIEVSGYNISRPIVRELYSASESSGVSLKYLMAKAAGESSFNPELKAKTSSATGIFQFTNQTWLEMMKRYGAEFGYPKTAEFITESNGKYSVKSKKVEKKILDLRKNPKLSALMAAAFAKENHAGMKNYLKREPYASELYLAHFLGLNGAIKLLDAMDADKDAKAYKIMPEQARANKAIFYTSRSKPTDSNARTVGETYDYIRNYFRNHFFTFADVADKIKIVGKNAARAPEDRLELKSIYKTSKTSEYSHYVATHSFRTND